jgi:hypothetical protein
MDYWGPTGPRTHLVDPYSWFPALVRYFGTDEGREDGRESTPNR